jgi:hypothetical protein
MHPMRVFIDNPYNSTMFTSCCRVAITDSEKRCPKCDLYVYGWNSENIHKARWLMAYKNGA